MDIDVGVLILESGSELGGDGCVFLVGCGFWYFLFFGFCFIGIGFYWLFGLIVIFFILVLKEKNEKFNVKYFIIKWFIFIMDVFWFSNKNLW